MAFENKLLAKLFEGVLENREITIRTDMLPPQDVTAALERLPISLSSCQRDAVANAWSSEISYIQGPPGTGKSHTITSIMLSAVFLKKRVLMVSHKRPAVEVVRRMLEHHLGDGSVIYLGPLTEQKKKLRGELQTWLGEVGTLEAAQRIRQKRVKRGTHLNEVERLLKQIQKMESELKAALHYERDFFKANESFLKKKKQL